MRSVGSRRTTAAVAGLTPAMSSAPLTRPATFVVASSMTAMTNVLVAATPPMRAGKRPTRSRIHRRPTSRLTTRYGPEPMGAKVNGCWRSALAATPCNAAAGSSGSSASTSGTSLWARLKCRRTRSTPTTATLSIAARSPRRAYPVAGFCARAIVNCASVLVTVDPSCQRSVVSIVNVSCRRSKLHCHDSAAHGSGTSALESRTSGVKTR